MYFLHTCVFMCIRYKWYMYIYIYTHLCLYIYLYLYIYIYLFIHIFMFFARDCISYIYCITLLVSDLKTKNTIYIGNGIIY